MKRVAVVADDEDAIMDEVSPDLVRQVVLSECFCVAGQTGQGVSSLVKRTW